MPRLPVGFQNVFKVGEGAERSRCQPVQNIRPIDIYKINRVWVFNCFAHIFAYMWLCIFYSFWLLYGLIDLIIVWKFSAFQAASDVSHRFPGLSLYAKEQICLIQEEIACLDKVSFKVESEMQVAINMKGQYLLKNVELVIIRKRIIVER